MNNFYKIATGVLAMLLVVSMVISGVAIGRAYSKDEINALLESYQQALKDKELEPMSASIATVDEQVKAINGSIDALEQIDAELDGYVDALEAEADALGAKLAETDASIEALKKAFGEEISAAEAELLAKLYDARLEIVAAERRMRKRIEALEAKDLEIEESIVTLRTYVDEELKNTEDWAVATFSTLEQYRGVVDDIAGVKAEIVATNESITALDKRLTDKIDNDVKAAMTTLREEMKSADDALAADYIARIEAAVTDVTEAYTEAVSTAKEEITSAYTGAIATAVADSEASLKSWVGEELNGYYTIAEADAKLLAQKTELETALEAQKDSLTALVTALEGKVDENDKTVKALIDTANEAIDACEAAIEANDADIAQLRSDLTKLGEDLTTAYTAAIATAIEGVEAGYKAADAAIESNYAAADAALRADFETQVNLLGAEFSDKLAAVESDNAEAIESIEAAFEEAYRELESEYLAADESLKADYDAKLDGIESDYKAADEALKAELGTRLDGIESDYKASDAAMEAAYKKAVAEALETANDNLATEISKVNNVIDALTVRVTDVEEDISNINGKLTSLSEQIDANKTATEEALKNEVEKLQGTIEELEKELNERLDVLEFHTITVVQPTFEGASVSGDVIFADKEDTGAQINDVVTMSYERFEVSKENYYAVCGVDHYVVTYTIAGLENRFTVEADGAFLMPAADVTVTAVYHNCYEVISAADGSRIDYNVACELGLFEWAEAANKAISDGTVHPNLTLMRDVKITEGREWIPVCPNPTTAYTGEINGNNFTVTGLTITNTNQSSPAFVRCINDQTVLRDLKLAEVEIVSTSRAAALVNYVNKGTVENCHVLSGSVTTTSGNAAGLVSSFSGGAITGCSNGADVTHTATSGNVSVAGIVPYMNGGAVSDCENTGNIVSVASESAYTGGIVANTPSAVNITIKNCTNSGDVVGSGTYTGGIIGYLYLSGSNQVTATIDGCVNEGDVYRTLRLTKNAYVGGISGAVIANGADITITVSNCTNSGRVGLDAVYSPSLPANTVNTTVSVHVGGITGRSDFCEVSDCTNGGKVYVRTDPMTGKTQSGDMLSSYVYVGGVVGYGVGNAANGICTIKNCNALDTASVSTSGVTKFYNAGAYQTDRTYMDSSYCGGIVGRLSPSSTLTACNNAGNVDGTARYLGGVAGSNYGTVQSCINSGAVSGVGYGIGGVVGNNMTATVEYCENTGNVYAVAEVASRVGGVVGSNENGTVRASCNSGAVTSENATASNYAGGVVGYLHQTTANKETSIVGCYNTGNVTIRNGGTGTAYVGGIVGQVYFTPKVLTSSGEAAIQMTVRGCYTTGSVQYQGTYVCAGLAIGRLSNEVDASIYQIEQIYVAVPANAVADEGYTLVASDVFINAMNMVLVKKDAEDGSIDQNSTEKDMVRNDGATAVDGTTVTWDDAAADMNAVLTPYGYEFVAGGGEAPLTISVLP